MNLNNVTLYHKIVLMTLRYFNNLSLAAKADTVWEWGFFVASRKYESYTVAVFLVGGFFAEVCISNDGKTESVIGIERSDMKGEFYPELKNNPFVLYTSGDQNRAA